MQFFYVSIGYNNILLILSPLIQTDWKASIIVTTCAFFSQPKKKKLMTSFKELKIQPLT